jgi:hypothetical protein
MMKIMLFRYQSVGCARLSGSGLATSAVEPTTVVVNELWSGDRFSVNVGRPQARWSDDLHRTAGRNWMLIAED